MLQALETWMTGTFLHDLVSSYSWVWPTLECLHFLGLILLIGSLLVVDLRVMGFFKSVPLVPAHSFVPVAATGFTINLLTGVLFLFGDPERYLNNFSFRVKMVLVLLAGLNLLYFEARIHPAIRRDGEATVLGADAKFVAAFSLICWFAVITMGRMIPYLE